MIGWLLQTKGLVMIVFVNILLDKADHQRGELHRPAADVGGEHDAEHPDGRAGAASGCPETGG